MPTGTGGWPRGRGLIDPANILVSADIPRGAGCYGNLAGRRGRHWCEPHALLADDTITVNDNVTVSTRSGRRYDGGG